MGAPVELPWWIVPLGLPPVAVAIAGALISAPPPPACWPSFRRWRSWVALAAIATRIASRNIQSVWISAAYAVWTFTAITWAVLLATG